MCTQHSWHKAVLFLGNQRGNSIFLPPGSLSCGDERNVEVVDPLFTLEMAQWVENAHSRGVNYGYVHAICWPTLS